MDMHKTNLILPFLFNIEYNYLMILELPQFIAQVKKQKPRKINDFPQFMQHCNLSYLREWKMKLKNCHNTSLLSLCSLAISVFHLKYFKTSHLSCPLLVGLCLDNAMLKVRYAESNAIGVSWLGQCVFWGLDLLIFY